MLQLGPGSAAELSGQASGALHGPMSSTVYKASTACCTAWCHIWHWTSSASCIDYEQHWTAGHAVAEVSVS